MLSFWFVNDPWELFTEKKNFFNIKGNEIESLLSTRRLKVHNVASKN